MAAVVGDDVAFYFEEEVDAMVVEVTQSFEVALAFGDDDVGLFEMLAKVFVTVGQVGAGDVGAVVDDVDQVRDADFLGVFHERVVEDRFSTNGDGRSFGGKLLDEEAVEDDLACVVGEVKDAFRFVDLFAKRLDITKERLGKGPVDRLMGVFFAKVPVDAHVDDVACDRVAHRHGEGILRRFDLRFDLWQKLQSEAVERTLQVVVRVSIP